MRAVMGKSARRTESDPLVTLRYLFVVFLFALVGIGFVVAILGDMAKGSAPTERSRRLDGVPYGRSELCDSPRSAGAGRNNSCRTRSKHRAEILGRQRTDEQDRNVGAT